MNMDRFIGWGIHRVFKTLKMLMYLMESGHFDVNENLFQRKQNSLTIMQTVMVQYFILRRHPEQQQIFVKLNTCH